MNYGIVNEESYVNIRIIYVNNFFKLRVYDLYLVWLVKMMLIDVNLECLDYLKVFLFCRMLFNVIEMGKYVMLKWNILCVDNYIFFFDEYVFVKYIVVYVICFILEIGCVIF